MKIEVGKFYKNASGGKAKVLKCDDSLNKGYFIEHEDKALLWHYEDGCASPAYSEYNIVAEWEEPSMKIESGKFYKTREGHKVGPAVKSENSASFSLFDHHYLFNMFYYSNGECHVGDGKYDIVSEWEEPKVEPTTETHVEPSGRVTVDITDRIDDIIRQDLEWCALQMLKEGNDKYEFIGNKATLFASFCKVIEYYSTKKQWEEFVAKTEGKKVE